MKEGTGLILWAVIILTLIIGGLVWAGSSSEKESARKCTILCEKKGMEFFDTGFYQSGRFPPKPHDICKCLDDEGELQEFER